jgi:hypothetical protein
MATDWEQKELERKERQRAAGQRTRDLRNELYGVLDDKEQAGQRQLDDLGRSIEAEKDEQRAAQTRGLSAKVGDTGFGGGSILAGAQAGKQLGETMSRLEREGRQQKASMMNKLLDEKKENIATKQAEGNESTDYDSVMAEGMKEMEKAVSDTRNPWYAGGDDEEEAERRMRAALASLRSKNSEAADYLEDYWLKEGGPGYKQNHAWG